MIQSENLICNVCGSPNKEPIFLDYSHLPEIQRPLGNFSPISYRPIKCKCLTRGRVLTFEGRYLDLVKTSSNRTICFTNSPHIYPYSFNLCIERLVQCFAYTHGIDVSWFLTHILKRCKLITVILPEK